MNPAVKYTLGRIGIFVVCLIPAVFLFPNVDLFLKLLGALLVSAVASFFLLRPLRDEVAQRLSDNARRRIDQKERLRSALSGDDTTEDRPTT